MIVGFVNSEEQEVLCVRCAKERGITESVWNGDQWVWYAIMDHDESEHTPYCDKCMLGIPCNLTMSGRLIMVRDYFEVDYIEGSDGFEAGWYFAYGSMSDHEPESFFGPYESEEEAIFQASEDYLNHIIEYA